MKYKKYIFPILMGAVMSNIMQVVNIGRINFPMIFLLMLIQATVASIASLIFPAGLVVNASYIVSLLMSSVLSAVYFTAILTMSGLLFMKGYSADFWNIYFSRVPVYIIYGYVVSIILNISLDKLLTYKGGKK